MTETIVPLNQKRLDEINAERLGLGDEAALLEVNSPMQYQDACGVLTQLKGAERRVKDFFKGPKSDTHRAWKWICARENEALDHIKRALAVVQSKLDGWERNLAIEAEAARVRLQREAEDARLEEAQALADAGDALGAEEALEAPVPVAPAPDPEPPRAEGIVRRASWGFELLDASRLKPEYLVPDVKKIGAAVRSHKSNAPEVVGEGSIKVFTKMVRAVRS